MKKLSKKTKSLIAIVLALVVAFGGTFAFFTDYASTQTKGTAGTVAVSVDSDMNLLDADGKDIINPGDLRDAGFTVTNEGNKSIDVRTTVVLTTQSKNAGVDLAFSGTNTTQSEYDLYLRSDVEEVEGRGWAPKDGAQPLQVKSIDGDTITYQTPIYSLNGNSDRYDEVETIDGVNAFAQTNDYVLIMKGAAGNEWQNSIVSIDVLVEAKQHENTGAGWDIVAQENVATGAINQSAVKGENVITNGTVSTFIPVISKNENGEDLNASATLIEGQKKADLMNSLDEAGLANSEDVDLLIDVKADDFDGMADTTFDVSNVANEGDTVVILHYDETKGEWEYIATDTVEDGKVGGDFSSYSPVAFIVIPATPDAEEPKDPVADKIVVIDQHGTELDVEATYLGAGLGYELLRNPDGEYLGIAKDNCATKENGTTIVQINVYRFGLYDENGAPIKDAIITLNTSADTAYSSDVRTDVNGEIWFYEYQWEADGIFNSVTGINFNDGNGNDYVNINVGPGNINQALNDVLRIYKTGVTTFETVTFQVLDMDGDPAGNVYVKFADENGNGFDSFTDADGYAYFDNVTAPLYAVSVYSDSSDAPEILYDASIHGDVQPDADGNVVVICPDYTAVATTPVLVTGPDYMPVEGATVTVYKNWTTVVGTYVTDADGYAHIPSEYVPASGGTYSCTIVHEELGLTSGTAKQTLTQNKANNGFTLQYQ